jgi:hypothetical protein
MIAARYESFLATGDWKETNISTPTIKGACYIDERIQGRRSTLLACQLPALRRKIRVSVRPEFQAQRRISVCGALHRAVLRHDRDRGRHEKNELVRDGEWIATAPAPGKFPSYHIDALSSPFVPWDKIAEGMDRRAKDPEAS